MIKIGLLTAVSDRKGGFIDAQELTDLAAKIRLDHVDYHMKKGIARSDHGYISKLKYRAVEGGLAIGHLTTAGSLMGPPERVDRLVAEAMRDVDTAVLLGSPMLRIIVGPPPEDDPHPEATWATQVRSFQEIADHAAEKAILVGLCNHNYGTGRPRGEDVVRACREIGRDNVSVIMDTGQWWPNSNTGSGTFEPNELAYGFMEEVLPHTASVAAKIYNIEGGTEDWVDYERVFRMLEAARFNGGVSIFYKNGQYTDIDYREGIAASADHLRGLADKVGL